MKQSERKKKTVKKKTVKKITKLFKKLYGEDILVTNIIVKFQKHETSKSHGIVSDTEHLVYTVTYAIPENGVGDTREIPFESAKKRTSG